MKRLLLLAGASLSIAAAPAPKQGPKEPAPRILLAGDSTVQTYYKARYPQAGWGQFLGCGLAPQVAVINRAIGGRSTKSFINEGRWDRLMGELQKGDTVLIQFGHNDATKAKPERFADPAMYRDNLLRFIWQTRGAGAFPVLVTPVARRSFDATGKARADFAEYSAVMRELAALTQTPIIDLEGASRNMLDRIGADNAKALYMNLAPKAYPAFAAGLADDTHFTELGARAMAHLVAEQLAGLSVPAAKTVLPQRPDLERTTPLGSYACH
ncbi:rhamnogalacturonan acetylesterase [Novosphingobium umbonatum]|uniref:Rhamnogalacturonan acetylesterase n=1 Tax=Novosphingobium umbonatum TaxID=1908524 RepID=A0A3S2Y877_9SPHN|nr:rhamnogalacturonan acetylesterase [Novosphingobium umbonatum]RVU04501.1 rhamnogalacturonan acetylesterase [Novosphingobium umbonatum]